MAIPDNNSDTSLKKGELHGICATSNCDNKNAQFKHSFTNKYYCFDCCEGIIYLHNRYSKRKGLAPTLTFTHHENTNT